ncbi:MAG: hypothetical protein HOP12_04030 [Candidatus Eisenbacteria bacterium]|uniref:Uncharacterized protein n=1 Tax=Eiseniibacteriota bacterium TaxID=2212470 RepID=A0A849SFS6_UNCEI|nr:hypothetical protein [Candidatus Eisenbacteria bacterium]
MNRQLLAALAGTVVIFAAAGLVSGHVMAALYSASAMWRFLRWHGASVSLNGADLLAIAPSVAAALLAVLVFALIASIRRTHALGPARSTVSRDRVLRLVRDGHSVASIARRTRLAQDAVRMVLWTQTLERPRKRKSAPQNRNKVPAHTGARRPEPRLTRAQVVANATRDARGTQGTWIA